MGNRQMIILIFQAGIFILFDPSHFEEQLSHLSRAGTLINKSLFDNGTQGRIIELAFHSIKINDLLHFFK